MPTFEKVRPCLLSTLTQGCRGPATCRVRVRVRVRGGVGVGVGVATQANIASVRGSAERTCSRSPVGLPNRSTSYSSARQMVSELKAEPPSTNRFSPNEPGGGSPKGWRSETLDEYSLSASMCDLQHAGRCAVSTRGDCVVCTRLRESHTLTLHFTGIAAPELHQKRPLAPLALGTHLLCSLRAVEVGRALNAHWPDADCYRGHHPVQHLQRRGAKPGVSATYRAHITGRAARPSAHVPGSSTNGSPGGPPSPRPWSAARRLGGHRPSCAARTPPRRARQHPTSWHATARQRATSRAQAAREGRPRRSQAVCSEPQHHRGCSAESPQTNMS